MLKILFFNNFKDDGVFILLGIQIFRLVIGLGCIEGRFDNIASIGLTAIMLDE